jgi:hypothetical protein
VKAVARITIIVGMGGSGKSMLCDEIAAKSNATAFKDATLIEEGDHHRRAGYDRLAEVVARLLGPNKQDCIMDEAHLVNANFRSEFRNFCNTFLDDVKQEWIFFEHNVVACINNIVHDWETGRKRDVRRLQSFANQITEYKVPLAGDYPGYLKPQPAYRQESPRFKDWEEEAALSWLYAHAR